jgi:SAM-dependent methyltransferase
MVDDEHAKIARFYDRIYYRDARAGAHPSAHMKRLADRLRIVPRQKLLDVACGTGDWLLAAATQGATVSGIDISERAIGVCRKRLPEGAFHVGPAESLPFPDRQFDLVTCLGSLEHFLDQPQALKEMVRVAKPEARVLILVPNAGFPTYRLGLYRGTHQQAVRETIRSLDEWRRMFEEAGLAVADRWKDLHILSKAWMLRPPRHMIPLRLLQGGALRVWPLAWQYQVYHLCNLKRG